MSYITEEKQDEITKINKIGKNASCLISWPILVAYMDFHVI